MRSFKPSLDGKERIAIAIKENLNSANSIAGDFVVVKAMEDGVTVIGLTRGHETRFAHSEKLDEGEVWISQFTELTSAMKVRGRAEILTAHGLVVSGRPGKGGKRDHEEG